MTNRTETQLLDLTYRTLISGCHILHFHGVLDAYGHLSVRHPIKKDTFLMPRSLAPALVSSKGDIVEYFVKDASPVNSASPAGYVERFIHSEIYKMYPEIQSVIHSHAPAILPYTITDVPLQPCVHMSAFIGTDAPNFDILDFYSPDDKRDLLVRNQRLGKALAETVRDTSTSPLVLMRGHGFTIIGGSIEEGVFQAIYTVENAKIQTTTLAIQAAAGGGHRRVAGDIRYLDDSEIHGATEMTKWSVKRPWALWLREVEHDGLYVNLA